MRFLAASFLMVTISAAQVPERFEVASLKPSHPGTRFSSTTDQAQVNCSAHTLMALIRTAYPDIAVESWRVSGGPSWLTEDKWDLAAKLPANMPREEERLWRRAEMMLQTLLGEEFKLRTHRETREYPVYAMVGPAPSTETTS
jgi:uncharacterized protein (TIGR03435 family)